MSDLKLAMIGKICLVTGATDGIGKVTARVRAEHGATVIGVGRDPAKIQATQAEIGDTPGPLDFLTAGRTVRRLRVTIRRTGYDTPEQQLRLLKRIVHDYDLARWGVWIVEGKSSGTGAS